MQDLKSVRLVRRDSSRNPTSTDINSSINKQHPVVSSHRASSVILNPVLASSSLP